MHPLISAIRHAPTRDAVLHHLDHFVRYLHEEQIDTLLPAGCKSLSAHSADDIRAWCARLDELAARDATETGMPGVLWSREVRDAFESAACRLEEIAREAPAREA